MRHVLKKTLIFIYSCSFVYCLFTAYPLSASASDASSKSGISKGMTAFIMIAVFLVTAVVAAFISYRLRVAKIRKSNNEGSKDNNE